MNHPLRCWRWTIARLSLFLLTALPAYSETTLPNRNLSYSPYYFGLAQSLQHQSNVYRLGDQQSLPLQLSKDDSVLTSALLGGIDVGFSRQHLTANLNLRSTRFLRNTPLNHSGSSLALAWDWASAGHLSGRLSASADRSLAQFNSVNGQVETVKNVQTLNQIDAEIALGTVTAWTAEAALGLRQRRFTANSYGALAYDQSSGSVGLHYRPSASLNLGVGLHHQRNEYPRFSRTLSGIFVANAVYRHQLDLTAFMQYSGASYFNGRLSPTRSRASQPLSNDSADHFSGLTGSAAWTWLPTGQLKIQNVVSRDSGLNTQAINPLRLDAGVVDYSRITTGWRSKADWAWSSKITLSLSLGWVQRDLVKTPIIRGSPLSGNSAVDRTGLLELGVKWQPRRQIEANCSLSGERRYSTDASVSIPLRANSWGCNAQLAFQ